MTSARRIEVIGLGTMVGMAGIEHGLGEALQGSVAPPGIMFESWSGVPWFAVLGGEPAMSLVPNLLVSGVLTIAVAMAFVMVAAITAGSREAAPALLGLSACLLLVGGGFGTTILGVLVAAAAARAWRPAGPPPGRMRTRLGAAWPWLFGLTLAAWLLVFPGVPAIAAVVDVDGPPAVLGSTLLAFLLVPAGVAAGAAFDARAAARSLPKGAHP